MGWFNHQLDDVGELECRCWEGGNTLGGWAPRTCSVAVVNGPMVIVFVP